MPAQGNWTPDRIETLKVLAARGYSAGRIAKDLAVSRNAIIGKLHRMNVPLQSKHMSDKRLGYEKWTPPRITELKALMAQGLSKAAVAQAMGVTEAAVCGIVQRRGIASQWKPPARQVGPRAPRPKPKRPDAVVHPDEPVALGAEGQIARAGECRWVHGDPRETWRMCCHPVHERSKWCGHHWLRVFEPKGQA